MKPTPARGTAACTAAWLAAQLAGVLPGSWACAGSAPGSREPRMEQEGGQVQQETWRGSFHLLWGDPGPPRDAPQVRYQLVTDQGQVVRLQAADSLLAPLGGPRGLDGKQVIVTGEPGPNQGGVVRVRAIRLAPP